jgi:hypothetical protein
VLVESYDEAIGDNLKLEVKRFERKVSMLEKEDKVQPSQNNRRNMVNKLEKEITAPKLVPQQQIKSTHQKKEERERERESILMKR